MQVLEHLPQICPTLCTLNIYIDSPPKQFPSVTLFDMICGFCNLTSLCINEFRFPLDFSGFLRLGRLQNLKTLEVVVSDHVTYKRPEP